MLTSYSLQVRNATYLKRLYSSDRQSTKKQFLL
jgi:hypothetical protein